MPAHRKKRNCCLTCGKECKRPNYIYCDNFCQQEFQLQEYIKRWKLGLETGYNTNGLVRNYIRRYLINKRGNKCEICGWCEIHKITGKVPITFDHVDGNYKNTIEENLKILCPNCHSLTPTFGALNRGNGRTMRHLAKSAN